MKIFEVQSPQIERLVALSNFLMGRARDTASKKEISITSFIKLARSLGIDVTEDSVGEMVSKPPLSNLIEPFEPQSGVIRFKGNMEKSSAMPVDKAENIVASNANAAMKRGMK